MVNGNFILIFLGLVIGMLLKRTGRLPNNAAQSFNAFVIWVSVPALILIQIPRLLKETTLSWELLIPVSMAWILFVMSFALFTFIGRSRNWSAEKTGALVLTGGLANTSFVGIPLLDSVLGPQSTPIALVVDQLGSFLTLSSLGVIYASAYSPRTAGAKADYKKILKTILSFPPFVALIFASVLGLANLGFPPVIIEALEKLGGTLVPLALIAVGYQLKLSPEVLFRRWRALSLGLSYKLVLAPLVFVVLYVVFLGSRSFSTQVTILESAMASMITAGVVAEEFGFDTELSSLMIGLGIPISLGTVILWNSVLINLGLPV